MTDLAQARASIPAEITDPGVVAIGRGLPPEQLVPLAAALVDGGVRAFEVTLDSPDALGSLALLADEAGELGLLVGAGTVLDMAAAADAVEAGARFLVSPHLDLEVVGWAVARGVPVFPGAFSPTEILAAWRAGATAVKLFPASAVGASFVRELRGPFRDVPLLPTGGLSVDTLGAWIAAGAVAVGMGGALLGDGEQLGVRYRARAAVAAVAEARG
jgi:2-dehydro-3-deoxyphosphogluconate aldolase/(4S)-4-hydroxy-2-oxoglutarate aldolase